jgi:hypothetical protein
MVHMSKLQVLATGGGGDSSPSVMIMFDSDKYLFNVNSFPLSLSVQPFVTVLNHCHLPFLLYAILSQANK